MLILKNVLCPEGQRDINVQVTDFDRRKDAHVDFAYAYADMLGRVPSKFSNVSDAAREYVTLFMHHKQEDELDAGSDYTCVLKDLRACRTLFHQPDVQKQLQDFFVNA